MILAGKVPALRRSYAEWYDWSRREIGGDPERLHGATRAAIRRLREGGGSGEAAEAARAAAGVAAPGAPLPAPGLPGAPAVGGLQSGGAPLAAAPAVATVERPPVSAAPAAVAMPGPAAPQPRQVYGGFWRRVAAWVIDWMVLLLAQFVLGVVVGILVLVALASSSAGIDETNPGLRIAVSVIGLVLSWLYFAGLESSAWQAAIGKRVMRLVVADRQGRRLSFGRATVRYVLKFLFVPIAFVANVVTALTPGAQDLQDVLAVAVSVSFLLVVVSYVAAAFTPRKQAVHDLIAGTLVARRQHVAQLSPQLDRVQPESHPGVPARSSAHRDAVRPARQPDYPPAERSRPRSGGSAGTLQRM
jgi:uncharacterized RDD family membrane protein YckC